MVETVDSVGTLDQAFIGTVIEHASIPVGRDDDDTVFTFQGTVRIEAAAQHGCGNKYDLCFVHGGSEHRQLATREVVEFLIAQSCNVEVLVEQPVRPASMSTCSDLLQTVVTAGWTCLSPHIVTGMGASEVKAAPVTPKSLELGEAICAHGSVEIGGLLISCEGTVAGQLWVGGAALGHKLLRDGLPVGGGPVVVELGAGTGFVGLVAAVVGARRVVLTDRDAVVRRLRATIEQNAPVLQSVDVSAAPLTWGDASAAEACCPEGCDLVVLADCLYSLDPSTQGALMASLVAVARRRDALIYHAYVELSEQITAVWKANLARGGLRLVRESPLEPPPPIRGRHFTSGRLVLEELRVV